MKKFLREILTDEHGVVSTKRISGLLCTFGLVVALLINTFSKGCIKPSETLVDAVALLAFGCLGLTSIDKFTKHKYKKD